MAIDTAEKRRNAASIIPSMGAPGVTPDASPDLLWRARAGWSYGFAPPTGYVYGPSAAAPSLVTGPPSAGASYVTGPPSGSDPSLITGPPSADPSLVTGPPDSESTYIYGPN